MAHVVAFSWEGKEYEFRDKSADWYWAVGILGGAAAVVAVLFGNILFAIVIALMTAVFCLLAAKHPETHSFQLTNKGLVIDSLLYPYETLHSFSILEYIDPLKAPTLSIHTKKILNPHIIIPLHNVNIVAMYDFLVAHGVTDGEHEETFTERLMDFLGF